MRKKRNTAEEIVNKLRQAEVELSRGVKIAQVCRKLAITEQTYYLLALMKKADWLKESAKRLLNLTAFLLRGLGKAVRKLRQ